MAIAPMKRMELYGLLPHKRTFLRELQKLGLVEIADLSKEQVSRSEQEAFEEIGAIEKQISRLSRVLAVFDRFAPQKPNIVEQFTGIRTVLSEEEREELLSRSNELITLVENTLKDENTYNRLEQEIVQTQRELAELLPWEGMTLSIEELSALQRVKVLTGTVEGKTDNLVEALDQSGFPYVLENISYQEGRHYLLVYLPATAVSAVPLKAAGFAEVVPPFQHGTVAIVRKQLTAKLAELEKKLAEVRSSLEGQVQSRSLVKTFYDQAYNAKLRAEVERHLVGGDRTFALEGWVEAEQEAAVAKQLINLKLPHELIFREPSEAEAADTPTVLRNAKAVSPFEALILSFSNPGRRELDPTSAVAPFFFLFFGIALGDAGYGAVLAAVCFVLLRKLAMRPTGKKMTWMFIASALGAVFFGTLTSSFFGYAPYKGLFTPVNSPLILLGISFGLGLIQLYLGHILNAWMSIREGNWQDAFWNQFLWLLFLTGIILVLGKSMIGLDVYADVINYGTLGVAVLLLLANTRGKKGLVAKLLAVPGGLFTIYNSIGFFSDVLSYARLMALGLSGGVMASVVNLFAKMTWNIPGVGWLIAALIFVGGHGLNFGLSILGAYVHSSRLQFLEFFSKFFEGGGRAFAPLQWENQYIFLTEESEA